MSRSASGTGSSPILGASMIHLITLPSLPSNLTSAIAGRPGLAQQPPAESRHLDFSMAKENAQDRQTARLRSIAGGWTAMGYPEMKLSIVHVHVPGINIVDVDHARIPEGFACVTASWRPHRRAVAAALFVSAPACVMHSKSPRVLPEKPGLYFMVPAFILITPIPWA